MNFKIAVTIPDMHIPWHDVRAFDVVHQILSDLPKIDELIILGDFVDYFSLSMHGDLPQTVGLRTCLEDEIYAGNKVLDKLDKLGALSKKYLAGNHEFRMERHLCKFSRALFDTDKTKEMLKLQERGWDWIPFPRKKAPQLHQILNTDVYCRHVPFSEGVNCAASTIQKKGISLIFGHTHRVQRIIKKRGNGDYIEAISCGCLIDFKAPVFGYMDTDDWAQSICVIYQFGDSPQDYIIDQISIKEGRAIYQGNYYESKLSEEDYYRNNYDSILH